MSELNSKPLEQLIKSLENNRLPNGKIGVLGAKNSRKDTGTNAEIGAKHELGLDGMPVRSWLRVPLIDNLEKFLQNSGAFTPAAFRKVIKEGSLKPLMERIMVVADHVIAEGFDTGGFGKWKPSNMRFKKIKQTLVETEQLRDSVTSEVK